MCPESNVWRRYDTRAAVMLVCTTSTSSVAFFLLFLLLRVCHPTMCSMIFNVDHSKTFPERRKPGETKTKRKYTLCTKSYLVLIYIYIYIYIFFFIPACTYYNLSSPSFLLLPPVVTQIRGHIAGSSPPAPTPLQEGDKISKRLFYVLHGKNVLSTQMLEVSRLLIGCLLYTSPSPRD